MPLELTSQLSAIAGIGPRRGDQLARRGLLTVEDLLWRLPFRFEDRSQLLRIKDLAVDVPATVRVEVVRARLAATRRRGFTVLEAQVRDDTGSLKAVFFNQPYLRDVLEPRREVYLFGTPCARGLFLEMQNPQVESVGGEDTALVHTGRIVPVYERIESLGPRAHRALVHRLLGDLAGSIAENLPAEVVRAEGLLSREAAFRETHFPSSGESVALSRGESPGRIRLAFEELFVEQLGLAAERRQSARRAGATPLRIDDSVRERVRAMLPFRLTAAQRRVLKEIAEDIGRERPMRRLLQGDVGAGKTVVAALAMAVAGWNRRQAALMAPTELLAEQHAATLGRLLEPAGLRLALLTGSRKRAERRSVLAGVVAGEVDVVVGTHALIEKEVQFADLALVVIDEQHRFGVVQREELGAKGGSPHVLVMTATPIPRSLALTVYGDLDLSVLDEMPPGRRPVRTVIKSEASEAESYLFVRRRVEHGAQAYVVCPLVEESEKSDCKAAADWAELVAERYFRGLSVGLVHGQLRPAERSQVMTAFSRGEVQVLVGTTVIEVGVDVPGATVMVIEHAERFGLSQLHQLRGRIGRGEAPSTCILLVRSALSEAARARLEVVRATSDGFRIAEADLAQRGPGDLAGTRQWGLPAFRAAHVVGDFHLLERARAQAARSAADEAWLGSAAGTALIASYRARHPRRPGN